MPRPAPRFGNFTANIPLLGTIDSTGNKIFFCKSLK